MEGKVDIVVIVLRVRITQETKRPHTEAILGSGTEVREVREAMAAEARSNIDEAMAAANAAMEAMAAATTDEARTRAGAALEHAKLLMMRARIAAARAAAATATARATAAAAAPRPGGANPPPGWPVCEPKRVFAAWRASPLPAPNHPLPDEWARCENQFRRTPGGPIECRGNGARRKRDIYCGKCLDAFVGKPGFDWWYKDNWMRLKHQMDLEDGVAQPVPLDRDVGSEPEVRDVGSEPEVRDVRAGSLTQPHPADERRLPRQAVGIGDLPWAPALHAGKGGPVGDQLPHSWRRAHPGHRGGGGQDRANAALAQVVRRKPGTGTGRAGALQAWHPPHRQLHHAACHDAAGDVHEVLDVDDGHDALLGELLQCRLGVLGSPAWLGGAGELQA